MQARALLWQVLVLAAVVAVLWYLAGIASANMAARGMTTGFAFLQKEAAFGIGESLIAYSPADTYARALLVGLLNTLKVTGIGIVLATILGGLLGIARVSSNLLVAASAKTVVGAVRNVPLLLQLFFWYAVLTQGLPPVRDAIEVLPHTYLSNRGLQIPLYDMTRLAWEVPQAGRFNFSGGLNVTPEFLALLVGLVLYTAVFIAEIVRSGILAVHKGQREAATALGLKYSQQLRHVVLPQAVRLMIPPMTSQYLNLAKNSSLAVAIGYPDIVAITNITINQTGQAIEGIVIIMAVYLTISLSLSFVMNAYNRRVLQWQPR